MLKWDDIAYLDLAGHRPVARGGMRNVYEVPEFPDMLIKTIRRDRADASGSFPEYGRIKNMRAFGAYHVFQRECFEYLRQARLRYSEQQFSLPAAHFFGFVQTSEGLGAVVEKVAGPNGDLAPTLRALLAEQAFKPAHEAALRDFVETCKRSHLVFGDVSAKNIAYTELRSGRPEWVCIDGHGEKSVIPIHRWSKKLNAIRIDRKARPWWRDIRSFHAVESNRLAPLSTVHASPVGTPE
nr:YrbL family protein [Oricola sp.]